MQPDPKVNEYIRQFPPEIAQLLQKMRELINLHAPNATESFAYGMPAYKTFGKPLIYYAAFSKHLGLYATPSGHEAFANELAGYKQGRGSVQFPFNQPIPFELIERILLFRIHENETKYHKMK